MKRIPIPISSEWAVQCLKKYCSRINFCGYVDMRFEYVAYADKPRVDHFIEISIPFEIDNAYDSHFLTRDLIGLEQGTIIEEQLYPENCDSIFCDENFDLDVNDRGYYIIDDINARLTETRKEKLQTQKG